MPRQLGRGDGQLGLPRLEQQRGVRVHASTFAARQASQRNRHHRFVGEPPAVTPLGQHSLGPPGRQVVQVLAGRDRQLLERQRATDDRQRTYRVSCRGRQLIEAFGQHFGAAPTDDRLPTSPGEPERLTEVHRVAGDGRGELFEVGVQPSRSVIGWRDLEQFVHRQAGQLDGPVGGERRRVRSAGDDDGPRQVLERGEQLMQKRTAGVVEPLRVFDQQQRRLDSGAQQVDDVGVLAVAARHEVVCRQLIVAPFGRQFG